MSTAFAQYLTARWLYREIQKDIEYHRSGPASTAAATEGQLEGWSITQCFFAVMGGIVVHTGAAFEGQPRLTLTAEGVRLLSFLGRRPSVHEGQIRDKSKADGLAKSIVCIQAGWMILQILGRLIEQLPVTLLEINTTGHVLCALVLYLLWWNKPLEVKDPTVLSYEEWMQPFLSTMWMCSPISESDGITEMRCMTYVSPEERRNSLPAPSAPEDSGEDASRAARPHHTHFSIGSLAIRDPTRFIGPVDDIRHNALDRTHPQLDHHVSYMISEKPLQTAPEHLYFLEHQTPNTPLRHSLQYCRRSYPDCPTHTPLPPAALARWHLANTLIDALWLHCQHRPSYEPFYFTSSSLGRFVGETRYLSSHTPNFAGLSYLGHVNIARDRLKAVLAFAAAAYGALHVAAWREFFPSRVERVLWVASALVIAASGVGVWLFFLAKEAVGRLEAWVVGWRARSGVRGAGRVVLALFVLARVYLVVEAFVSLREVPVAVYATPGWTDLLPHL